MEDKTMTTLQDMINNVDNQIKMYCNELANANKCGDQFRYVVIDDECKAFTIGVGIDGRTTTDWGVMPHKFTLKEAQRIVEYDVVRRKNRDDDGWHDVPLKVMYDEHYYKMKLMELDSVMEMLTSTQNKH